jgi:predicted O-methyltransferase YrrM
MAGFLLFNGTMSKEQWSEVDSYITGLFNPPDPALEAALQDSADADLPSINVAPNQGKLLMLLAQAMGAKQILEIGTLGGYSTIWLARALPTDGRLITLEFEAKHAQVATNNINRAGLSHLVELRQGRALDLMKQLVAEKHGPFDFIFIDADKQGYADYFQWAMKLSRRGTLIIADNVVRKGEVVDPSSTDANVQGIRRFNDTVAAEKRVCATAIQTVGSKGYDGLAFAVVTAD